MKFSRVFLWGLLFLLLQTSLVFLALLALHQQHEQAHHQIYASYEIDSNIVAYNFGFSGFTVPDYNQLNRLSEADWRTMNALQDANEVYGYQVGTIIVTVFGFSVVQLLAFYVLAVRK